MRSAWPPCPCGVHRLGSPRRAGVVRGPDSRPSSGPHQLPLGPVGGPHVRRSWPAPSGQGLRAAGGGVPFRLVGVVGWSGCADERPRTPRGRGAGVVGAVPVPRGQRGQRRCRARIVHSSSTRPGTRRPLVSHCSASAVKIGSSSGRGTVSLLSRCTPMTGGSRRRRIVGVTRGSTPAGPSRSPTGGAGSTQGGAGLVGIDDRRELVERHGPSPSRGLPAAQWSCSPPCPGLPSERRMSCRTAGRAG